MRLPFLPPTSLFMFVVCMRVWYVCVRACVRARVCDSCLRFSDRFLGVGACSHITSRHPPLETPAVLKMRSKWLGSTHRL